MEIWAVPFGCLSILALPLLAEIEAMASFAARVNGSCSARVLNMPCLQQHCSRF